MSRKELEESPHRMLFEIRRDVKRATDELTLRDGSNLKLKFDILNNDISNLYRDISELRKTTQELRESIAAIKKTSIKV